MSSQIRELVPNNIKCKEIRKTLNIIAFTTFPANYAHFIYKV